MTAEPHRLGPEDPALGAVLHLIRTSFAYMDGRIDPPSSMHRLTVATLAEQARTGEVWTIGAPPRACAVLSVKDGWLYLGKLAVALDARGAGHARALVETAAERARALGLAGVELQSRVELAEVHAAVQRMGFVRCGETAHAGYDRPTSITFRRRCTG